MRHILIAVLMFLFASAAVAGGGQAVQQWWDGEYKQTIEPQQEQAVESKMSQRCKDKLKKYEQKAKQNPDDLYYDWKLQYWEKKCK